MNYLIIRDYESFCSLRSEWNALLHNSSVNSVFLTWEWLDSWWQVYRTTEVLNVILIKDECDELVGIAPFVINTIPGRLFAKVRALYFLGIRSDQKLTEYIDIIAKKGSEQDVCEKIVDIINASANEWDIFMLNEIPEGSFMLQQIYQLLLPSKLLFAESSHGCSVIKIPDTFETYLKSLKPRIRTKFRSLPRRLEEDHEVVMELCTGGDMLKETMESFYDLHQKRWEFEGQLGTFRDKRKIDFYERVTKYFTDNEWLSIYSLKVDGHYRAHEYCFLYDNKLYVLQEGFDPEWLKKGVGNVLRTYVIKDCIAKGIEEYDFLGGVTFHKSTWGVNIKNSLTYTFGKRTPMVYCYFYIPIFVEKLKGIYRSAMPQKIVQWRIDFYNKMKNRKARVSANKSD